MSPHHLALLGHLLDVNDDFLLLRLELLALAVQLPHGAGQRPLVLPQQLLRRLPAPEQQVHGGSGAWGHGWGHGGTRWDTGGHQDMVGHGDMVGHRYGGHGNTGTWRDMGTWWHMGTWWDTGTWWDMDMSDMGIWWDMGIVGMGDTGTWGDTWMW